MEEKNTQIKKKCRGLRIAAKLSCILVFIIVLLPAILYIPFVQEYVKTVVAEKVSESTGYNVEIGRFLLKFPLKVSVDDFFVKENARDTLVSGKNVSVDVRLLPLLMGDVVVRGVELNGVGYRMVSADSSMILSAKINDFKLRRSTVELLTDRISLSEALLDGADVDIVMDSRKARPSELEDTVSSTVGFLLDLHKLSLKNVHYSMSMMPAIDSLSATIAEGTVDDVAVNLTVGTVKVGKVDVNALSAMYLLPDDASAKSFSAVLPVATDSVTVAPSKDWAIMVDSLRLRNSDALYAKRGVEPAEGLDFNYIKAENINISIDGFYNKGTKMRVPVRKFTVDERSGLAVRGMTGTFEMDGETLKADDFVLSTLLSEIKLDAGIDTRMFSGDSAAKADVSLQTDISLEEIGKIYPALRPALRSVSRVDNAKADVVVNGTGAHLDLEKFKLEVPGIVSLSLDGVVKEPFAAAKTSADVRLRGVLSGGDRVRHIAGLDSTFSIPVVKLSGRAGYSRSRLDASLSALVDTGNIVLKGGCNIDREHYSAQLDIDGFDLRSFMPYGQLGRIDCSADVSGDVYDIYTMCAKAVLALDSLDYDGNRYKDISVNASVDKGKYLVDIASDNEFVDAGLSLFGKIAPDDYAAAVRGEIRKADLTAMNFSERELSGKMGINGVVRANVKGGDYRGFIRLADIGLTYGVDNFSTDSINIGFSSDSLNTRMRLRNKDLLVRFESPFGFESWSDSLSGLAQLADSMLILQRIDIASLKQKLPGFEIGMGAGKDNILYQYLQSSDVDYEKLFLRVDKKDDLRMHSYVSGLVAGGVPVDTVLFKGRTRNDSLLYGLRVVNTVKNSSLFKMADLKGGVCGNELSAYLVQFDKDGAKGFDFGLNASIKDSVATLHLLPVNPVIAFRDWTLNEDNFLSYDLRNSRIQSDLRVKSGDNSHINIYTDATDEKDNGINIDLAGIELGDWLTLSPFSPPVDGVLSSNLKVYYNDRAVWGNGKLSVGGLYYGKRRIGDIYLDSKLAYVGNTRNIYAAMDMNLDGKRVATVRGYRNDTIPSSLYDLRINMERFPLSVVNAFMPEGLGNASGYLNVGLNMTGTMEAPDIRGYARFDSARVVSPTYGARFDFDTVGIPVENGLVKFNEYKLFGANGSPVVVDGSFRFMPFDGMRADLNIQGKNVQMIDSKKTGSSELYGKGYVDLWTDISGYLNGLDVKASLSLLSGTDLTYVVQTATRGITQSSDDGVVEFVSLNDTVKTVAEADTLVQRPFSMRINAMLTIQPNAVFTVYLSPDGKNRVNIDGEGDLSYSQTYQGDVNVTGKYVINDGYVRYTPPMLSEKLFNFVEGSSVVWTGDMLNPSLNVKAVETVKANVTTGQNSRLVPFDVSLNVGSTLSKLDVTFDLSTEADMTIANELSGMTQEQRSTQAMNLLLYGAYTGGSTGSTGALSGENMAFSFLESSLNKWAANNISGVDLSFGIDQYDKTVDGTTSTTTSYSYKMSKSIFDDRFKIVVGGNYSTDDSAEDNLAQNLFNDISFEYKLNKAGTSYLKLFRRTEYESILEGEITETGGGFVWRRKISSWKDMFRIFRPKRKQPGLTDTVGTAAEKPEAVVDFNKQDEDE